MSKTLKISALDLVSTRPQESVADAIARTVQAAQFAEAAGFTRYWLAEHHSIQGLACSATSVLIGHVAGHTRTIRVGSGGVMLPNHPPLVIAEQFGTLASLYPNRIDLGLGRAPGSDAPTMRAMRRDLRSTGDDFPDLLHEFQRYLGAPQPGQLVQAIPGQNTHVPITLLGSSGFSAQLAGQLGLPFAFAAHFAPDNLEPAIDLYRHNFRPSDALKQPYVMAGIPVIAAQTDAEAHRLFTTPQQRFLALIRNQPVQVKPPVDSMNGLWNPMEREAVDARLRAAIVGTPDSVRQQLQAVTNRLGLDEVLIVTDTFDTEDRLFTYQTAADAARSVTRRTPVAA